ncbi:MAG: glycoside hydrolase family 27 protein [Eubacterium sp.]|nr:glycoside hydrolase family 27 protein [Eubacterium sp.]
MPAVINDSAYRYDSFSNGEVLFGKKNCLPAMGWNSWNAFGSGNTELLTKAMAEKIVELGLDKLGYKYVVLDDGCYRAARVDGHLESDEKKFPGGFMAMSDFIHGKGLKFGMYNDVGSRLCSGLEVGTCGYEDIDARDYIKWKIDYFKIDNCYNVWDNATFSNPENARFTFAPDIYGIRLIGPDGEVLMEMTSPRDGIITGTRAFISGDHVTGNGTYDGTGPDASPVGEESSELHFKIPVTEPGEYGLSVLYRSGKSEGCGQWLQVAVGSEYYYDDFLPETDGGNGSAIWSESIRIKLGSGENLLRLMNHRRQENTLTSYAKIREEFAKIAPDSDIIFSICEWGKTQPQNWGYKVGDSWRILNDITFQVGSDGDSGHAAWEGAYTTSVTAQYNKAVIMDEFAGLGKGWNDPDMLMIGMNGLSETMCKTHMTMWCMLNSPLMLGMDLRNVEKGDWVYSVISNSDVIALNQDALGVQAKRIYTTKAVSPDTTYIRDNDRLDVLAKPLADGSVALSFINVSLGDRGDDIFISKELIKNYIGSKMIRFEEFFSASGYEVTDIWTKEKKTVSGDCFRLKDFHPDALKACDNVTIIITAF